MGKREVLTSMTMQQADLSAENNAREAIHRKDHVTKIARATVTTAINEAIAWIKSDPAEFFLYKYPRECEDRTQNRLQLKRVAALDAAASTSSEKGRRNSVRAVTDTNAKCIDWLRIDEFSLHQLVQLVYDYLSLWRLTPTTQYMVRLEDDAVCREPQGNTYSLNALFTRRPQHELVHCNPLTMAQVNFKVHVSHVLPKFYPVMMTYRFENCNRDYYAIGNRRISRLDFQRFFIDMALETKLGFYAQFLKTLAFATEPKFADNQKGIRRVEKMRVRDVGAKMVRSRATMCMCAREENEKQADKSNNEKEVEGATESSVDQSSLVASCDYEETDNMKINESCERVKEYFEFLNGYVDTEQNMRKGEESESVRASCEKGMNSNISSLNESE